MKQTIKNIKHIDKSSTGKDNSSKDVAIPHGCDVF